MSKLSKILKLAAHPLLGILPGQEYLERKIQWYDPAIGVGTSSSAEIIAPLIYISINPSLTNVTIGGLLMLDGFSRLNEMMESKPPQIRNTYNGSFVLELPHYLLKKSKILK